MRLLSRCLMVFALLSPIAACSSVRHVPQPILERTDRTLSTGDPTVEQDVRACRTEVREGAPMSIQPRWWLPPLGTSASGVVLGTVPHPVWPSRDAYRQEIEHCLKARGYEIHGWQ